MKQNFIAVASGVLLALAVVTGASGADDFMGQNIKGFRYPDYDDQGQLKMEVAGDKAQILPEGLIQISNLKMTFYEEGKNVMNVATPLCFYDRLKQTAVSTAQVCVTRAEIKITGNGFSWNESAGQIRINDNARVILQKTEPKSYLGVGDAPAAASADLENDTNNTVITSTTLTFDQKKSTAVFEGHVVVTDPALKISSDRLTVLFSNDKKLELINAEGNVVITRDIMQATAKMASYSVREGKIFLWGQPSVLRQKDYLTAETIVFWRDSNRIICEPNAHLTIYTEDMNGQFNRN